MAATPKYLSWGGGPVTPVTPPPPWIRACVGDNLIVEMKLKYVKYKMHDNKWFVIKMQLRYIKKHLNAIMLCHNFNNIYSFIVA